MRRFALFWILLSCLLGFLVWFFDANGHIMVHFGVISMMTPLWLFILVLCLICLCFAQVCKKIVTGAQKQMVEYSNKQSKMKKSDVDEALLLLFKTMTATTEGDLKIARSYLRNLKKIVGKGPISEVLELKILKGEKKFDEAEKLSLKLLQNKESELVGLKSLIETSSKKKEFEKALISANKAFETRQDLYWVLENTFRFRVLASDWTGALDVLEAGLKKKLIDKDKYAEFKGVTLYEIGLAERKEKGEIIFLKYLMQIRQLYPSFVPAALDLAMLYEKNGQVKQAQKVLREIWHINPTADVAKAYLKLFKEYSPIDRVQKMESFTLLNTIRPSLNNFLLAELDMKAKLYDKAHAEFEMFLINNPATKTIAKLMAQYEKEALKNSKAASDWIKREKNCEDDCLWVCTRCGEISSKWKPFCKKCGHVNPFEWVLCVNNKNK